MRYNVYYVKYRIAMHRAIMFGNPNHVHATKDASKFQL